MEVLVVVAGLALIIIISECIHFNSEEETSFDDITQEFEPDYLSAFFNIYSELVMI